MVYRPELDGLRAVAVSLVVFNHVGLAFTGGFVGVDVFFVISGYLITRLIKQEQAAGSFSLRAFWIRRARRIFPAAFVMTAITFAIGYQLFWKMASTQLGESVIAQLACVSNFYFLSRGGYFDLPSTLKPLLHTWSLSVEEQFYLVYPLLVSICRKTWITLALFVTLALLSLTLNQGLIVVDPATAFFFTPGRIWELLLGGILATAAPRLMHPAGGWVGLAMIGWAAVTYSPATSFPGLSALLPCCGSALVIGSRGGLLAWTPLVWLGRASYSIYLWHWPVLVYTRFLFGPHLETSFQIAVIVASLFVGVLSFRAVETPFRKRVADNRGFIISVLVCAAGLCLSVAIMVPVFTEHTFRSNFSPASTDEYDKPTLILGMPDKEPVFALWGDSHASPLMPVFDDLAKSRDLAGICIHFPGYVPLINAWTNNANIAGENVQLEWNREAVAKMAGVRHVFIVARWDSKVPGPKAPEGFGALLSRPGQRSLTREASAEVFRAHLSATAEYFHARGTRTWFIRQVPLKSDENYSYQDQQVEVNAALAEISVGGLSVIGPAENWFNTPANYYKDNNHLSREGADALIRPLLLPIFDDMN